MSKTCDYTGEASDGFVALLVLGVCASLLLQ